MLKKSLFLLTLLLASCGTLRHAHHHDDNERHEAPIVSLADMRCDGLLLVGTYDELVARMGNPKGANPHIQRFMVVEGENRQPVDFPVTTLVYDNIYYVQKGDSVQLYYVDLETSGVDITLPSDMGGMVLSAATTFEDFHHLIHCSEECEAEEEGKKSLCPCSIVDGVDIRGHSVQIHSAEGFGNAANAPRTEFFFSPQNTLRWILFGELSRGGIFHLKKVSGTWLCE